MDLKKIMIGVVIVAVIGAGVWAFITFSSANSAVAVKVFEVQRGNISTNVSAMGIVEKTSVRNIALNVDVVVEKIPVQLGSKVESGDVLVEIDASKLKSQYEQQKINYATEMLQLKSMQNKLELKDILETESSLQEAELGLKQMNVDIKQHEIDIQAIQENLETKKKLFEAGAIPKVELDEAQKEYDTAVKELENLKIEKEITQLEYDTALKTLEKLKEDNNALQIDQKTQIEIQKKKVELAALKLNEMELDLRHLVLETGEYQSPVEGTVSYIGVKEGEYIQSGEDFMKIDTSQRMKVVAKVNEEDIKTVRVGNKVDITGYAFDGTISGKVSAIAPFAHKEKIDNLELTVIDVEIEVEDSERVLKPGYNVDLRINTVNKEDVLVVHRDAIKKDRDGQQYVYVVEGNNARRKDVRTAATSDSLVEVVEGLNAGETVIYNAKGMLEEHTPVEVIE